MDSKPRPTALVHACSLPSSSLYFPLQLSLEKSASTPSNKNSSEIFLSTPKKHSSKFQSTPTKPKESSSDRFIPVRNDMVTRKLIYDTPENPVTNPFSKIFSDEEQSQMRYQMLLEGQVLGMPRNFNSSLNFSSMSNERASLDSSYALKDSWNKLLQFKTPKTDDNSNSFSMQSSPFPFGFDRYEDGRANSSRKITTKPYKVLDAPQLEDDYYLNLIDWSKSNILAVALQDAVHLWSGTTGHVKQLCQLTDSRDIYTSVSWSTQSECLATGISNGKLEIWDFNKMKVIRDDLEPHYERIGCLSWNNRDILASGSKDRSIILRDMRIKGINSSIMKFKGHKQEICGLKWSPNDSQIASGGNDNKLFIWSARKREPEACFNDHKAAVKALAWSPHQSGLLLSGGGNNDKTIKVWNTHTLKMVKSLNTGSQVCNMVFSKNSNELVTTHGFSNNQIIVWNYPDFNKVGVMEGHASRVLYLALSPDGETVVTGAGANDETLRFWHVFQPAQQGGKSALMPSSINLR